MSYYTLIRSHMNILIVDGNSHMLEIASKAISELPFVGKTKTVKSYSEAVEMTHSGCFDCYVLEEYLPGTKSGTDLAKKIKTIQQKAIVILITGFPDKSVIDKAFRSGVDDFVRKDALRDELGHRITRLYQYKINSIQPSKEIVVAGLTYYPDSHSFVYQGAPLNLTKSQAELLAIFVTSPSVLLSKEQLRSKLWGDDYSDTFAKPRNLAERIYELKNAIPEKLQTHIVSMRGQGYIFETRVIGGKNTAS